MKMLFCGSGLSLSAQGFLSLALVSHSSFAADVKSVLVQKEIQYFQTSAAAPIPDLNNGAIFEADVKNFETNTVTSVTIKLPNAVSDTLPQDASDEFKLKKKYNKQSSLDASFPNGSYTLGSSTVHDGLKTFTLDLVGDIYPNTPQVSNFAALQTLDAGAYALCAWDTFTGGTANDFIQLHLDDSQGNKVWETPDIGEVGALDGRATSVLIPARALAAGQTYQASLLFAKASTRDLTSYPGALGAALYEKRTKFTIQTIATASRAEAKLYGINKSQRYEQKDNGAPALQTAKPLSIDVVVEGSSVGSLASASIVLPGGAPQALSLQPDGKTFAYTDNALLQSGLDATYPNGTYTFQMSAPTGLKTPALNLSGNAYPPAPHLAKLPPQVDPSASFTIQWDPFVGASSDDFAQLHVEDDQAEKVFETPDFGKSGALKGTTTEAIIPANTLAAGKTYSVRVIFQKNMVIDTTSYPGALGVASYGARTTFSLTTAGGTSAAPHLNVLTASLGGDFRLGIQAAAGRTVRLESSSDLRQWNLVSSNSVPATGQLTITESTVRDHPLRFYRAILAP